MRLGKTLEKANSEVMMFAVMPVGHGLAKLCRLWGRLCPGPTAAPTAAMQEGDVLGCHETPLAQKSL